MLLNERPGSSITYRTYSRWQPIYYDYSLCTTKERISKAMHIQSHYVHDRVTQKIKIKYSLFWKTKIN